MHGDYITHNLIRILSNSKHNRHLLSNLHFTTFIQPLQSIRLGQPPLSLDSVSMLRKIKSNCFENMCCPSFFFFLFASLPSLLYVSLISHNVVVLQHSQCPIQRIKKSSFSSFSILNHISLNHYDLHLLEILIHRLAISNTNIYNSG